MGKTECLFCRLYENNEGIIYEDDYFWSKFDMYPVTPGHVEVIPKRHVVSLADLTVNEWAALHQALIATINVISQTDLKKVYTDFISNSIDDISLSFCSDMLSHHGLCKVPDAYNHGVNDGEAAGRTVHHLHWHIIPRYIGDVLDPRGGVRHVIPEKGNYKTKK